MPSRMAANGASLWRAIMCGYWRRREQAWANRLSAIFRKRDGGIGSCGSLRTFRRSIQYDGHALRAQASNIRWQDHLVQGRVGELPNDDSVPKRRHIKDALHTGQ